MFELAISGLGSALYGLSLGVLSYRSYIMQKEILKGDNSNAAFSIGTHQAIQATTLLLTIANVFPSIYSSAALSYGMSTYPFLAAFVGGGYEQIRYSLLKYDTTLQQKSTASAIVVEFDKLINRIPRNIAKPLGRYIRISHRWLGTMFMAAQFSLLSGMLFGAQPIIGALGASYLIASELRTRNKLPTSITRAIEKVDYWVGLFSGVFLRSTALRLTAGLRIGYELVLKFVAPVIMRKILGTKTEFTQFMQHEKTEKPASRIKSEIQSNEVETILSNLPNVEMVQLNNLKQSRMELLQSEVKDFIGSVVVEANSEFEEYKYTTLASTGLQTSLTNNDDLSQYLESMHYAKIIVQTTPLKFAEREEKQKYTLTAIHMGHVPKVIPPITIDFAACRKTLENHYELIARDFSQTCFDSPKFYLINEDLGNEYVNLKKTRTLLETEHNKLKEADSSEYMESLLVANSALIDENKIRQEQIKQALIKAHGKAMGMPDDVADIEIIMQYYRTKLLLAIDEIEHAKNILANKKVDSIPDFKLMGRHVLNKAMQLLDDSSFVSEEDLISPQYKAYQLLAVLAIEGGDHCSTAIVDVVQQLFQEDVLKDLLPGLNLSAYEKVALYLQDQRQILFDQVYAEIGKNPYVRKYLPEIDFSDRHTYVAVARSVAALRLKNSFNALSELTGQSRGFFTELGIEFIAYIILRIMTGFKYGYSVEYVLNSMNAENSAFGSGVLGFNINLCISEWAAEKGFTEEVQEFIENILIGYSPQDEILRRKLCLMMLYDMQIFDGNDPAIQAKIEEISPIAKQRAVEKSPYLTHVWSAAQTAYTGSAWLASNAVTVISKSVNIASEIEQESHKYDGRWDGMRYTA